MALSKLAVRRLNVLADFMDALPPASRKHFDMDDFLTHEGTGTHPWMAKDKLNLDDLHTCGTSACAFGYACVVPSFRKAGLYIDGHGYYSINAYEFFDLHGDDGHYLFGAHLDVKTPKQWVKRCRQFLREHA